MKYIDVRLRALLVTLGLVITIVVIITFWPDATKQQQAGVTESAQASVTTTLFATAVNDLRKRHYIQAIESFREVLKTTPSMPEAYVNIGFANLELKQYEQAKIAFNTALDLRTSQVNAYWGLAISHEGLCDISAAIGAMKTYIHLAKQGDPYLKKANAALWEWGQLKKKAEQGGKNDIACS